MKSTFSGLSRVCTAILLSLLAGILFFSEPAFTATNPKSITIGFIPGDNPSTLKESSAELARLLQAKIGIPVNVYISKDYSNLIDAMKEKKVDFAFMSAMTFVFAEKLAGAKVLLKKVWEGPFYYSTILVRADSKITKLSQLKGKKLAFVDEKSASGYLYPQVHFKKEGIEPKTFFSQIIFAGNHEAAVKLLADGKVDAITVYSNDSKAKESAWNHFIKEITVNGKSPQVRSLWVSEAIPNDPFCVRQDFYDAYPKTAHDLMFDLIELDQDSQDSGRFRKLLGVSALMLATSQQYDPVREMVKELNLTLR
jgi:phosphonate transport system substrate-binding protein